MKSKYKFQMFVVLVIIFIATTFGCHRKVVVTDVPVGISVQSVQNWYAAVGIYKEMGEYTKQLTNATIQLRSQFPSQEAYDKTLTGFAKADQIGIQGGLYLQSVPATWTDNTGTKVADYANQISAQIDLAVNDGLAGVKDSAAKQAVLALVGSTRLAISTAIALNKPVGGK